jgi:hypothetical protein
MTIKKGEHVSPKTEIKKMKLENFKEKFYG